MTLIASTEVERVFDRRTVKQLAALAKLPNRANLTRFGESVRIAVNIFIKEKGRLSTPQMRSAIKRVYHLTTRAESGSNSAAHALAKALDTMPDDVREWLSKQIAPGRRKIPSAAEILSPSSRKTGIERMRLILSHGGRAVVGRKRPNGRHSRSFEPLLRAPTTTKRGRPTGSAERNFLRWLAIAYLEATGEPPPRTANFNPDIRGPFSKFVHQCFALVGAATGNVTRLLNQYGMQRRQKTNN